MDNGQWTMIDVAKAAAYLILRHTWTSCPIGFALPYWGFAIGSPAAIELVEGQK
jgi:hypothetical protein